MNNEQGTPVDLPFLDGFPPKDELPSATWTSKLAETLVRIILGSVRYTSSSSSSSGGHVTVKAATAISKPALTREKNALPSFFACARCFFASLRDPAIFFARCRGECVCFPRPSRTFSRVYPGAASSRRVVYVLDVFAVIFVVVGVPILLSIVIPSCTKCFVSHPSYMRKPYPPNDAVYRRS